MKVRAHVLVTGFVQGVFFRSETRQKASMYNVRGWIRNIPDGRVEAVFEGEKRNVMKLVEFCRNGPRAARVIDTEVKLRAYSGEFEDFRIIW
ncbi:MAG: acylphosphatase [Candidatus Bathyarchaeota archaeon]|nr:MAG: acylphosphatase [Candidatus Bathyarchaeota archaeon]